MATLRRGAFQRLAVTKPARTAYGAAARELIDDQGLLEALKGKLVEADDDVQTLQQIDDGVGMAAPGWCPRASAPPQTHSLTADLSRS